MKQINDVEQFWNSYPCGAELYFQDEDKRAAFKKIEKERYRIQSDILKYANFAAFKGKKVLEVGCGIGTDGLQFAKNGAFYTGIDLTDVAINITRERFELFGQAGQIIKTNAENLPFPDGYFDHVYSFGAIHHSPQPERIVAEIYRCLKPGGTITIMLYNRTSFYYLIEVKIIRKIFFYLCDKKNFCRRIFKLFNKKLYTRFESFRGKLEQMKMLNRTPTADEWISMNTDNVFCPIAKVYSKPEVKRLFYAFHDFKTEVWFIDKDNWALWLIFGRFIPRCLIRWLEFNAGWFRMVQAEK